MHTLHGALPVPYVPVRVTRGGCCDRTSVHLCASSLQNLAVLQDFCSPVSISVEGVPVFNGVGHGFQELGQCLFIGLVLAPLLSPTVFHFLLSFYGLVL